ncbi:MAG: sel1 repeat family protein [Lentisphaeria bacterium]|nr:sel1 repeat family protein [Lentisphaeria bacterium]
MGDEVFKRGNYAEAEKTINKNDSFEDEQVLKKIRESNKKRNAKTKEEDIFEKYLQEAREGQVMAQYHVGHCYSLGDGVAKDLTKAAEWYRKAAEQGLAEAQYNLGLCFENGYGIAKDYTEAAKWYRMAANQGNEFAKKALNSLGVTW